VRRTHVEPLPRSRHGILSYIDRAAFQPHVLEVALRPDGIHVTREVGDKDEPVVPTGSDEIDIEFLLSRLELVTRPISSAPLYTELHAANVELLGRGREAHAIFIPGYDVFEERLGVPMQKNKKFFGISVIAVNPLHVNNQAIVVGTPPSSLFLTSADLGVVVDLGL
jgi:hypothetical protein